MVAVHVYMSCHYVTSWTSWINLEERRDGDLSIISAVDVSVIVKMKVVNIRKNNSTNVRQTLVVRESK